MQRVRLPGAISASLLIIAYLPNMVAAQTGTPPASASPAPSATNDALPDTWQQTLVRAAQSLSDAGSLRETFSLSIQRPSYTRVSVNVTDLSFVTRRARSTQNITTTITSLNGIGKPSHSRVATKVVGDVMSIRYPGAAAPLSQWTCMRGSNVLATPGQVLGLDPFVNPSLGAAFTAVDFQGTPAWRAHVVITNRGPQTIDLYVSQADFLPLRMTSTAPINAGGGGTSSFVADFSKYGEAVSASLPHACTKAQAHAKN